MSVFSYLLFVWNRLRFVTYKIFISDLVPVCMLKEASHCDSISVNHESSHGSFQYKNVALHVPVYRNSHYKIGIVAVLSLYYESYTGKTVCILKQSPGTNPNIDFLFQNGITTSLPFICNVISNIIFCRLADFIRRRGILSTRAVRVIAAGIGNCGVIWIHIKVTLHQRYGFTNHR